MCVIVGGRGEEVEGGHPSMNILSTEKHLQTHSVPAEELKPGKQLHMKLPIIFTQIETVVLQVSAPEAHSSISIQNKISQSYNKISLMPS